MRTRTIFITILLLTASFLKAQENKILFVMSAAKELPLKNGKTYNQTGVFLSEFYLAYKEVVDLGYGVDFATPGGIVSSIDKESYDLTYWKGKEGEIQEAKDFINSNPRFNRPLSLENALQNIHAYSGIIVPGGQGLMVDLIHDEKMSEILKGFSQNKKPIGLICHAPALILSIPKAENPFVGYKVNSVSGFEEFYIEKFVMKGKPYNRKIARQLKSLGLDYKHGKPKQNFAIKDRELVTSQNPFSNEAFIRLYIEALKEYRMKKGGF
ncbi:DJ-1/PfpI family protein [Sporocytophaga myxococcoides]|uniref:DJ-1/PfpI family protein n=1 Tax=Sporocytophaga myxococcoides TaxID=153721 RepID=UPI000693F070|nr:DJ-1/PfpI family protein [Sporocytophaga myxococcoides]